MSAPIVTYCTCLTLSNKTLAPNGVRRRKKQYIFVQPLSRHGAESRHLEFSIHNRTQQWALNHPWDLSASPFYARSQSIHFAYLEETKNLFRCYLRSSSLIFIRPRNKKCRVYCSTRWQHTKPTLRREPTTNEIGQSRGEGLVVRYRGMGRWEEEYL